MFGIAIEASTVCPACGEQIAMNALVPEMPCIRCGAMLKVSLDEWDALIADVIDEAPEMKEGEGRKSSIITKHGNFDVTYGRQKPRFDISKKNVDLKAAVAAADGFLEGPGGERVSVRAMPHDYAAHYPGITRLLCEDPDLFPGVNPGMTEFRFPLSEHPQPFSCPQCGGTLSLDGTARTVHCDNCGTASYIPDPLWLKLHPASVVRRWYLLYGDTQKPYRWKGALYDLVADGENLFLCVERYGTDGLSILSYDAEGRERWKRNEPEDLKIKTTNGDPRLSLAPGNRLFLWSHDRHSLYVLSRSDGNDLDRLGGKKGRAPAGGGVFSMKQTLSLAVDTDDTIVALQSREKKDVDDQYYRELVRYTMEGRELPFWPEGEANRSIVSRVKGFFAGMKGPAYFDYIGYRVTTMYDYDTVLSVGNDGHYYLLYHEKLARYDRTGRKIYGITLPCEYTRGRACADGSGYAYVLCTGPNDTFFIHRVSPDGGEVTMFCDHVTRGGHVGGEQALAMAPGDTLYAGGYGGRLVILSPDGELIFSSAQTKKENSETILKAREREEEEGL